MRPHAADTARLTLPCEAASVGLARRFVRQTLVAAQHDEWIDAATLAVSELVTNSVLHARSDFELALLLYGDHVRIEVLDRSPALPAPRSYDAAASTGRGLDLIAAVSFEHGVDTLGPDGKIVWCCVNDAVGEDQASDITAGELDWAELDPEAFGSDEAADLAGTRVVTLVGLPPTLWLAARQHQDGLLREMMLLQTALTGDQARSLAGDLAAGDQAGRLIGDALTAAIDSARRRGEATAPLPEHHPGDLPLVPLSLDLELHVRPEDAALFSRLQDVLDLGERLAHEERLLARPALPEVVAVRDWACEQVIAQIAGTPPGRWTGADDDRFTAAITLTPITGWSDHEVTNATTGVIAVDDANRIVAVSDSLLQLLGWQRAELVARRVVAIVPPRYREAHVAGFSRHLSTGVAHALDIPLRLPVLRADGSEVECEFLIHAVRTTTGRAVYTAHIRPASPDTA